MTSFEKTSIPLPFALSRLEVVDYQGIKHLIIENLPMNKQWIFLTGENGFGKTSILKAIAKGLVGDEESIDWLPKQSKIYVQGNHWNQPFSSEATPKNTPNLDFPIATYGASRFRVSNIDPMAFAQSKYSKKTYSLFNDDGLLLNIERVLVDAERDDLITFNRLKAILLKVIPNLADIKSEVINKVRRIRYYEKSEEGEMYAPVFLSELAAGYRSILTMIGDMMKRLSEHPNNPLENLQGMVVIDEFDAHLHPKYQYELPNLLSEAFPKVQFIVATHSPIPLLGVQPDTAIVLTVHRNKTNGITVERLDDDIEIRHLSANALLTSDIFSFKSIFARGATPDTMIPFNDYKEVTASEKLALLRKKMVDLKLKPLR
jgi:predicted ATP-binding protein involved in virulence